MANRERDANSIFGGERQHSTIADALAVSPGNDLLAKHASEIRTLGRRTVGNVIEIGRLLSECRKMTGHGGWLPWLESEFGWSDKTAERFMAVHRLGMKFDNLSNLDLPVGSLYLLAARSTPEETRTEVIHRVEAGEEVRVERGLGLVREVGSACDGVREQTCSVPVADVQGDRGDGARHDAGNDRDYAADRAGSR